MFSCQGACVRVCVHVRVPCMCMCLCMDSQSAVAKALRGGLDLVAGLTTQMSTFHSYLEQVQVCTYWGYMSSIYCHTYIHVHVRTNIPYVLQVVFVSVRLQHASGASAVAVTTKLCSHALCVTALYTCTRIRTYCPGSTYMYVLTSKPSLLFELDVSCFIT